MISYSILLWLEYFSQCQKRLAVPLHTPSSNIGGFWFVCSAINTCYFLFFSLFSLIAILLVVRHCVIVVSVCILLDMLNIFHMFSNHLHNFLGDMSIEDLCQFCKGVVWDFFFSDVDYCRSLWILILFQILGLQTLLFSWLIFSLLIALFDAQVFNFEVYLFLKKYCCLCFSVRSNKLLPNLMSWRFPLMFSPKSFIV